MAGHHGHHMHSMGMDHTTAAMETDNSTCSQACISAMQQMMHHMTHGSANHAMGGGEHGGGHNLAGHYGYFHSTLNTVILLEEWTTSTWQAILFSCIGIFVLGIAYEGIKTFREAVTSRLKTSGHCCRRLWSPSHIGLSFLHVIQTFISYLLMLVFMTFNAYLCAAVLAGAFVGYFMFRWNYNGRGVSSDLDEHCK